MNVSPNFSPSLKLMRPYFMLCSFFYVISIFLLFFIELDSSTTDFSVIGWTHTYMLGFVMMAIFSAMAQLGPVVVETKHYNVNIFKYVWVFLLLGLLLLIFGFFVDISLLTFGGFFVLIAMSIYAVEFLLTLKNANRKTAITKAMKMSNFFLLLGIISGIIMSFALNNYIDIDPHSFLKSHTFGLLAGFVILLIMGISIVLIPMFGYSKRISDNEFSSSFFILSSGVLSMFFSPFLLTDILETIAVILTFSAIVLYMFQLYKMTTSRAKVIHDIWARSMYVGFASFIISFILLISYLFYDSETLLKLGMWIMLIGFFGFLIIGNYYKIIPFLIWFQIYAPLIEEQSVPMLHELLPNKVVNLQWFYSTFGLIISSIGIASQNSSVFYGGVTLLFAGGLLFIITINKLLNKNL